MIKLLAFAVIALAFAGTSFAGSCGGCGDKKDGEKSDTSDTVMTTFRFE